MDVQDISSNELDLALYCDKIRTYNIPIKRLDYMDNHPIGSLILTWDGVYREFLVSQHYTNLNVSVL